MRTIDLDHLIRGTPDIPAILWFWLDIGEEENVVCLDTTCFHLRCDLVWRLE